MTHHNISGHRGPSPHKSRQHLKTGGKGETASPTTAAAPLSFREILKTAKNAGKEAKAQA